MAALHTHCPDALMGANRWGLGHLLIISSVCAMEDRSVSNQINRVRARAEVERLMCEHYCEHNSRHTVKLGLLESMHSCMHACMHAWQSACTRSRLILRCRHSPCPRPCPSTCAACCHTHPTPSRSASGCGSPGGTWTEHHGPQAAQSHTPAAGPGRHMVGVQTSATMQQVVACCMLVS
jgi:hypothetical protein